MKIRSIKFWRIGLPDIVTTEPKKTFTLETSQYATDVINRSVDVYGEANRHRYSDPKKYSRLLDQVYQEEIIRRTKLFQAVTGNKKGFSTVLHHISRRESIIDFIVDWCWTYDPRLATVGLPTALPFTPFPTQVDFMEWLYNLYLDQKRGLIEKSRDAGATWLFVLMMTFEWRWTKGFAGGIGSNKLDNVDDRDNPDCIFEKIRSLMKMMPPFWFPPSFNPGKHMKIGNIVNPDMGSYITGQGGKDIGRGGRRTIYLVDEAASLEFPLKADAALSANTNCQIDLSTPKGMNHFGQKRHNGRIPVFTFHWKKDPRKDQQWYDVQKKEHDPVVVAQEIDINYHASVEGIFIKPEWIKAAVELKLKPIGPRGAGLDVAAGGTNKSALAFRFGPCITVESFNIENGVELTHMAIDMCNKAEVDHFNYDRIGVGHAVYSTLTSTEKVMNFPHYGLEAGDSPSDIYYEELKKPAKEIFINARAEWWYCIARRFEKTFEHVTGLREYSEGELISIPNDGQLIAELASPKKFHTEQGKIKCESKQAMLKRGIKSPDKADALVLAFQPRGGGNKHIVEDMDASFVKSHILDWSLPEDQLRHYGAMVMDDDLTVHCMFAVWDQVKQTLYIYDELTSSTPDCEFVVQNIIEKMRLRTISVDKFFGNDLLFGEHKRTVQKEFNRAFSRQLDDRQSVKIKQCRKMNPHGSLVVLKRLIETKKIFVDPKCKEIYNQFISWKLENKKFKHTGMQEGILMILSELMGWQPFKETMMKRPEYTLPVNGDSLPMPGFEQGDPLAL